jgi:hypothetical protein
MKTILLSGMVLLVLVCRAPALTNIYYTGFSKSEGYNMAYELAGQNGWVTDSSSYGGNGLLTNFLGIATNQAAYVGLWPLSPVSDSFSVWQPLKYAPLATHQTLVKFSASILFVDSTTSQRDDFYWTLFNSQNQSLFSLHFNNYDLGVYYRLDGTNDYVYTGATFTNDTLYTLLLTMDFARNRWNATLNGASLVGGQSITTTNALLDLGDIDAVWLLMDPNAPGDNFMIFDDYLVTADADVPVKLASLGRTSNGQFLLRVTGPSNFRYAIDAATNLGQWTPLKTNTITDGYFDFIDTAAGGFSKRFYRARQVQ